MARIFQPPRGVPAPSFDEYDVDGRFQIEKMKAVDGAYLDRLREWLTGHGYAGPMAGEVARFGHADGQAQYMVMSLRPPKLMHLPLGDAWRKEAPFERGLSAADITANVERGKRLAELFSANGGSEKGGGSGG